MHGYPCFLGYGRDDGTRLINDYDAGTALYAFQLAEVTIVQGTSWTGLI
jgi:hypothetical protein